MFYFSAERFAFGESVHQRADRLDPDARNLSAVLHTLRGLRGTVFDRLVCHLREIFPTFGNLSVAPRNQAELQIRVWPTESMEEEELSFPLSSGGTGVAQVVALLTAIMTMEKAVIIIDEINSFLHPSAIKELLRILKTEYYQHQYIISTHATEVISFSNPTTIHLVKRTGYESSVERLDQNEVDSFREVGKLLGVSMADVFAADRIIWVEGPTEELTFPYLYQHFSKQPLPKGVVVTSVAATGDFNRKRDREIVYEIYRRLSSAIPALDVDVVFSFDTEELSTANMDEMKREAGGNLYFLPRRHIECYLLDPEAISAMIIAKDEASALSATSELVSDKIVELANDQRFKISEWVGDISDLTWLAKVDAANIISQATTDLSQQRATFNKKKDSLGLAKDILHRKPNDPGDLKELYNYVNDLVEAVTRH